MPLLVVPLLVMIRLLAIPFVVVVIPIVVDFPMTAVVVIPSLADKVVVRTSLADSSVDSIQNCPDGFVGLEYEWGDSDSSVG